MARSSMPESRSCAVKGCRSVYVVCQVPQHLVASGFDTEGLGLALKPVLKTVSHLFQRTMPIAEQFQSIRVECQKPFRAKQPPLDDVNKLMKMERLVMGAVGAHEICVEAGDASSLHLLEVAEPLEAHRG